MSAMHVITNVENQHEIPVKPFWATTGYIVPAGTAYADLAAEAITQVDIPVSEDPNEWHEGFVAALAAVGYALADLLTLDSPFVTALVQSTIPDWADHTVAVRPDHASYLEESGRRFGLRIADLGGGLVALDAEAIAVMRLWPEDADGCVSDLDGVPTMWLGGVDFTIEPTAARD